MGFNEDIDLEGRMERLEFEMAAMYHGLALLAI